MKAKLMPWIIALILFAIPFFWLKSGEMDLGGDSSRLYFYDPVRYLKNYSLFAVSPSGVGAENIGFMTIPLVAILAAAKQVVSSTVLIRAFHGLSLAAAFVFVYLSVRQLLGNFTEHPKSKETAAMVSGLLYVFSPISILGWDKVLITHNHIFLNPFMFYVLLRYANTDNIRYLILMLLTTFIFSANFSFVAAPVFAAFYPMALLFYILYKRTILKRPIIWKHLLAAAIAFIGLQAFHVVPQVVSMLTPGSVLYTSVFSSEGKLDRGLGYFSAIVPSIKTVVNLLIVPQMTEFSRMRVFMIFVPFVVMVGFMMKKTGEETLKKMMVVIGGCFLTVLFFASANITDLGLSVYKKLFIVPGFSIFRNFYGQWASAYLFYYVVLFGLALSIFLRTYRKANILLGLFLFFLVVNAWPFISGATVNPILWQSDNIRIAMRMDPAFTQVLSFLRQLPADGKVLTLPLTDPGYQIVAGQDAGAYEGPSMIAYLAGKQDFAGIDEFGKYRELLLDSIREGNLEEFKRILGILNIRYVFYNSDPRVYDAFPTFPYQDVKRYFPKRREEYKRFVDSLSLRLLASFDDRFFVYELEQGSYAPRVYVPRVTVAVSRVVEDASVPLSFLPGSVGEAAFFEGPHASSAADSWYLAEPQSYFLRMVKNPDPPRILHHSFVTTTPSSILYPLVSVKETFRLWKLGRENYPARIDQRSFLSTKRVLELERWGETMPVLGTLRTLDDLKNAYQEPGVPPHGPAFWSVSAWRRLNSWEATLSRYYGYFDENIRAIEAANESPQWKTEQRFLLSEYLLQHYRRLTQLVRQRDWLDAQGEYLEEVTDMMFGDLLARARVDVSDLSLVYGVQLPTGGEVGAYDVYVDASSLASGEDVSIQVDGKQLQSSPQSEGRWVKLGTIATSEKGRLGALHMSLIGQKNLLTEASRISLESATSSSDSAMLMVDATYIQGGKGLTWKIDAWQPQSYYLLTFEYQTSGEPFVVRTLEGVTLRKDSGLAPAGTITETSTIVADMLKSPTRTQYQAVIRTNKYVNTGFIQIVAASDQSSLSRIELTNMSLVHLPHPAIFLHHMKPQNLAPSGRPQLAIEYINPTQYRVTVTDAHEPYVLLVNQAFDRHWKVYPTTTRTRGWLGTWGTRPVAEDRHFQANGYANAWYIIPSDFEGLSTYSFILETTTQRYFYVGAGISFVTLLSLALYFIRSSIRYDKKYRIKK